jgi:toxin CcdB
MPQFDVYQNYGRAKKTYPFVVDVQNELLSEIATRIVVPLALPEHFIGQGMSHLMPEVEYNGAVYLLATPQLASVPVSILRVADGTLVHYRDTIISALDFAITGI